MTARPLLPVVLRPARLDARDTAIVLAVVSAWADGLTVSYRQIEAETGISKENICWRILGGYHRKPKKAGCGLVESGWLLKEGGAKARTLRPGPRFGGVQWRAGRLYELVRGEREQC